MLMTYRGLRRNFTKIHADILRNMDLQNTAGSTRRKLILESSINAFKEPENGQHLSHLGDLTSYYALLRIRDKMIKSESGRRILKEQPRFTGELDFETLKHRPNSLGAHYAQFMTSHSFRPEERPLVKYVPDYELAYIMQRYREVHDFLHVIIGCPSVSIIDELYVKWFELIQLELPSAGMAVSFGSLLAREKIFEYWRTVGKVVDIANRAEFFLNIPLENHLEDDIQDFRRRYNIKTVGPDATVIN